MHMYCDVSQVRSHLKTCDSSAGSANSTYTRGITRSVSATHETLRRCGPSPHAGHVSARGSTPRSCPARTRRLPSPAVRRRPDLLADRAGSAVDHEVGVLRVPVDVPPHEGAQRTDPPPAGADVVEGATHQSRADAPAFLVLVDLGVREHHDVALEPVLREAEHGPVAVARLVPVRLGVVDDFDGLLVGHATDSMAARQPGHGFRAAAARARWRGICLSGTRLRTCPSHLPRRAWPRIPAAALSALGAARCALAPPPCRTRRGCHARWRGICSGHALGSRA